MMALNPAKQGDKWNKNKDARCASRAAYIFAAAEDSSANADMISRRLPAQPDHLANVLPREPYLLFDRGSAKRPLPLTKTCGRGTKVSLELRDRAFLPLCSLC